MSVRIVQCDIFERDADECIVHQCNCVTRRAKGLAAAIFNRHPYADVYSKRTVASNPGSIELRRDSSGSHAVIALYGQIQPGKSVSGYPQDSYSKRLCYFKQGLQHIAALQPKPKKLAFPHGIGCGMAGGDWLQYEAAIIEWAAEHCNDITVTIYKLPPEEN